MITIEMSESDIIRAIKSLKYSPIQFAISRILKEDINNIDVTTKDIAIWNDDINDYHVYKYNQDDLENIQIFLNEWEDFSNLKIEEFLYEPFVFEISLTK